MKYSRNPKSGEVEIYTDEGVYVGNICSMGDMVGKQTATDGGAGSGNFGHSGRPGKRGGSAKRGGGGGGSGGGSGESSKESESFKARSKLIQKARNDFKKKSKTEKIVFGREKGFLPPKDDHDAFVKWKSEGDKKGLSVDKYIDYCAARYFTIEKYKKSYIPGGEPLYGSKEYKTPMKPTKGQEKQIHDANGKIHKIQDDLGVDSRTASLMQKGLSKHFGNGAAVDPWIDRYIDADHRYEGPIYRWKGYWGDKADDVVKTLVPGAKIQNPYGSNWSFSSDPDATKEFGSWDSPTATSICYICDDNKTAAPVQCYSGYGEGECEVLPHSKTSYTIQSVEKKTKPSGGDYYEVHMTEDDWHEEQKIPVWSYEEYKKSWEENFPDNDVDADHILQDIKTNGDMTKMKKFLDSCPDGTEILSLDKNTLLHKEDGVWYGVGVDLSKVESFDELEWYNLKEKAKPVGDSVQFTAWQDDSYISKMDKPPMTFEKAKLEFDDLVHSGDDETLTQFLKDAPPGTKFTSIAGNMKTCHFEKQSDGTWKEADGIVQDVDAEDIWIYADDFGKLTEYPTAKEKFKSTAEASKEFEQAKKTMGEDMMHFLDNAPIGTTFEDGDYGFIIKKNEDGTWSSIDGVLKPVNSHDAMMFMNEEKAKLLEYPFQMEKSLPGEPPKSYGEVESKLVDLTSNQDYDGIEEYLDSLPDGTKLYDEDTDKVWEKTKVSDTFSNWKCYEDKTTMTSGVLSGSVVNKQSFSVHDLPLEKPKDVNEANKALTDVLSNKPVKLGGFIGDAPVGSVVISLSGGGTTFKKTDSGWDMVSGTDPENLKAGSLVKHTNGIEVHKVLQLGGCFVKEWGKEGD